MDILDDVIFYHIERAIKSYRQFAQARIKKLGHDITIDQWLVLKVLSDNPDIPQKDLATAVFKDNASVTRIIDLLVQKKLVVRQHHKVDGRRATLKITGSGHKTISKIGTIVALNRKLAQAGIKQNELDAAKRVMRRISNNCSGTT